MSPQNIPIVDSHHHIWLLKDIPWLQGPMVPRIFGDYTSMKKDYTGEDYLDDLKNNGVTKSVYVQANWDTQKALEEVKWVQSVSDELNYPNAIVGYSDIASSNLPHLLDEQMKCPNFRGIRQQLHWHPNPQYQFASSAQVMRTKNWTTGFREIERRGLTFELQIFSNQVDYAIELLNEFSKTKFILTHAGMLESKDIESLERWRTGMKKLSKCPNLYIKLSGLGTFEHKCELNIWQPIVDEMIELFGANRCMFGSNFPVEKLWTSYAQMISVIRNCLSKYSIDVQEQVLNATATKIYNI